MSFSHTPVLCREVLTYLAPERGGVFVDGTLGGGGHIRAAGCEFFGNLENAKAAVLAEVKKQI